MALMGKLIEIEAESLWRGNVLRVPGKFPYENVVDFMLFETQDEEAPVGLVAVTGYKAGLVLVCLPRESFGGAGGVSREWIISNWDKWIYPDCDVSDVYLLEGYVVGGIN